MIPWLLMIRFVIPIPSFAGQSGDFLVADATLTAAIPMEAGLSISVDLMTDEDGAYLFDAADGGDQFVLIVLLEGLESPSNLEPSVRAAQFFIEYETTAQDAQNAPFVILDIEPGGPGAPEAGDASPMQAELARQLELPVDATQMGTLGYAVGVEPDLPIATEDCVLATITVQALEPGEITLWFRDPAVLPTTMLADDDGRALSSPELALVPADEAQAIRIRFAADQQQEEQTPPPDTDPPSEQSLSPNTPADTSDGDDGPGALSLDTCCGNGFCGVLSPACVPLLLLSCLQYRRRA